MPTRRLAHVVKVLATALVGGACSSEVPLDTRGSISLRVVSGDGQSGVAGTELPEPLVAQVLRNGIPVQGQIVNFRVTAGDGSVFAGAAITGTNGIVQERWTLGPVPGNPQRVEARAVDNTTGERLTFAVFTATALPSDDGERPVSIIVSPSQDTSVPVGAAVDFQGTAIDDDGFVVSHAWNFGDGRTATVEDPGPRTYSTAGTYTVTYRVTDNDGATSVPATVVVTVTQQAPTENFALRFYGNGTNDIDRVKIRIDDPSNSNPGPPADIGATDLTIEFWMLATAADNGAGPVTCGNNVNWISGNVIIDRDRYGQDRKFGLSMADGRIVFGVTASQTSRTICGTTRVDDGAWHHVAVTRARATGALRLFVDGVLQASVTSGPGGDLSYPDDAVPPGYAPNDPYFVIGAEKHDAGSNWPSFSGMIDELRLSTVIRYAGNFTRPSTRFAPDANTAALYHFDEGTGNTIVDASAAPGGPSHGVRRFGGSPAGPVWVASSAPTATP